MNVRQLNCLININRAHLPHWIDGKHGGSDRRSLLPCHSTHGVNPYRSQS